MKVALLYLLSFVVVVWASPILAQSLEVTPKPGNAERVRFVTDQQAGAVTIMIDGVPAVRIDKTGMQVSGTITYSGDMTDLPLPTGGARAR